MRTHGAEGVPRDDPLEVAVDDVQVGSDGGKGDEYRGGICGLWEGVRCENIVIVLGRHGCMRTRAYVH